MQFALTLAVLIGRPGPHTEAIASLGRMPEMERPDILILIEDGHARAGSPEPLLDSPGGRSSLTNSPLPVLAEVAGLWHHGIDLVQVRVPSPVDHIHPDRRSAQTILSACNRGLGDER